MKLGLTSKVLLAAALGLAFSAGASAQLNLLVNGGFESPASGPVLPPGGAGYIQTSQANVSPWQTTATDGLIELWESGYTRDNDIIPGTRTYFASTGPGLLDGQSQFAELNATQESALFQDIVTAQAGLIDYYFLHRGRLGDLPGQNDTLRLTILYLGADGVFDSVYDNSSGQYILGDDDVIAFTTTSSANYAGGWVENFGNDIFTSVAGGVYRFTYGSATAFGASNSNGNFIDNAAFGFDLQRGAVPEPSTYGLIGAAALLGLVAVRRIRSKSAAA